MTSLTHFEPVDDWLMAPVHAPMRDRFRRLMHAGWPAALRESGEMKVDVTENDQAYTVKAEIPGAKKEDITVKIDGNLVSISAEVKEEKETKGDGERVLAHEIYRGSMSRGFTLAHEINDKQASAKFENGMLTLTLPKRAEAKGTTLAIS